MRMTDNRAGVMIATVQSLTRSKDNVHALVIDHIKTSDRPAALGYFLLNILLDFFRKNKKFPIITLETGSISIKELEEKKKENYPISAPVLTGEEFGDLYELIVNTSSSKK